MNPGSGGRLSRSQHSSQITPHRSVWAPRYQPQKEADEPGLGPVLPQRPHPSPDLVLVAESSVGFCPDASCTCHRWSGSWGWNPPPTPTPACPALP